MYEIVLLCIHGHAVRDDTDKSESNEYDTMITVSTVWFFLLTPPQTFKMHVSNNKLSVHVLNKETKQYYDSVFDSVSLCAEGNIVCWTHFCSDFRGD